VVFKLTKRDHKITSYGDINELAKNNITNPSLKDVSMLLLPFDKANYRTPKNWETVVAFLKSNLLKTDFEKIHQQLK
jgi:UDP-N-acetylmuramate dehydrogenase